MKQGYIVCLMTIMAIFSCKGREEELKDGKKEYAAHRNEVEVMTLESCDFPRQLLSNGTLRASARASLAFGQSGPLAQVNVSNGARVAAGQTLAKLGRPDLELSLRDAVNALEKAEYDMYDFLAGQGYPSRDTSSVPKDLMAVARMRSGLGAAQLALERVRYDISGTILKAPFTGRVADISLKVHDRAGTDIFCTLVDDSLLDVDFKVMESEYSFLEKGLPVKVVPYADRTRSYRGQVVEINPLVDSKGQISVRARVRNDGTLLDGMNVKVTVEKTMPNQLVVPRSAVVIRDNMDVLFTYSDDGHAHWTYVNILHSNGDSHVVCSNADRGARLEPGDKVIISGNLNLADKSEVVLKQ